MKGKRQNRQSLTLAACIGRLTPLDDIMFKCADVPAVLVFHARYRGTDAFGQLMQDLRTADLVQMTNPLMAQTAARAKSRKGGRGIMEGILQEYGQARELEGLRKGRAEERRRVSDKGRDEQVQGTLANLAREGITNPARMARIAGCSEQEAISMLCKRK